MTYEEAMLLAAAGYTVRRLAWHSPKQFVRYIPDHKYRSWKGFSNSSWYPKEVDTIAEDWDIYEDYPETWQGWYYPEMRKEKAYMLYDNETILLTTKEALSILAPS